MARNRLYTGSGATVVSNRTTPLTYETHIVIIANWYPLIGDGPFALYSIYRAMAAMGLELGVRKIGQLLYKSQTAVKRWSHLLWLLELIEIEPGSRQTPNVISILDPTTLTRDRLPEIRQLLADDEALAGTQFADAVLRRLDDWRSLEEILGYPAPFLLPDAPAPRHAPPPPRPAANGSGNGNGSDLVARLRRISFDNAAAWLKNGDVDHDLVAAWLDLFEADDDYTRNIKSLPAYLRAQVKAAEWPPEITADANACPRCGERMIGHECLFCAGIIER